MTDTQSHAASQPSWLKGRSIDDWRVQFDRDGYIIFEDVLSAQEIAALRSALAPRLDQNITGRNDFEGLKSNRIYALLAKSPLFADLAIHEAVLPFAEADLGPGYLLSACLAINLHPSETAQPWHFDDSHYQWPRPRPSLGVSVFWPLDDMTEENGATEIIPGSHLWGDDMVVGAVDQNSFDDKQMRDVDDDPGARPDAMKVIMSAGSVMMAKGTLWHRGGANKSGAERLIVTPQYCAGWARQLENMVLAVPPEIAKQLPKRAQELIGYSIQPPFMGYVDGVHPKRTIE